MFAKQLVQMFLNYIQVKNQSLINKIQRVVSTRIISGAMLWLRKYQKKNFKEAKFLKLMEIIKFV